MKYYVIAGEASGDLHGSNLMKELKLKDPEAQFRFWGGDLMAEVSGHSPVKHYKDLAFMGFLEVVQNLRTIMSNMSFCKKDVLEYAPDAIIFIDYPGFNLRIAEYAKTHGIKTIYYISPQIWAWKKGRIKQIKANVDKMLVILPFEKPFYQELDYSVDFVGHPLLDAIEQRQQAQIESSFHPSSEKPVIALLPGSRKQEISSVLPTMVEVARQFPEYQFCVACAPSQEVSTYEQMAPNAPVQWVKGKTYDLLEKSHAAIVTSGTATLETALFKVPEIVVYKGSSVSYLIAKQLVKIKYISLVNLIMDKPVVTELIQGDYTVDKTAGELRKILVGEHRKSMMTEYEELNHKLGGAGASARAAQEIIDFI